MEGQKRRAESQVVSASKQVVMGVAGVATGIFGFMMTFNEQNTSKEMGLASLVVSGIVFLNLGRFIIKNREQSQTIRTCNETLNLLKNHGR